MVLDSFPVGKRQKLGLINPENAAANKAMIEAAKEKFGRAIRVFDISSQASAVNNDAYITDDAEDFYDLTTRDYLRMRPSKKEADKQLKTKKTREAEVAARRSRMTKAVIRVKFPDNNILEFTFHPSEPIQTIIDLVKKALAQPNIPFYLYTTPPKQKIVDLSQDFYSAGFVPGAIVYFSYDLPKDDNSIDTSGPFLQEDVLSLKGLDMTAENAAGADEVAEGLAKVNPFSSKWKPELSGEGSGKPKWLKM